MQGGIGGHAGLFSNAYDLAELGELWLRGARCAAWSSSRGSAVCLDPTWIPRVENRRGMVFDNLVRPRFRPDVRPGPESYGHTGFTGTLLW